MFHFFKDTKQEDCSFVFLTSLQRWNLLFLIVCCYLTQKDRLLHRWICITKNKDALNTNMDESMPKDNNKKNVRHFDVRIDLIGYKWHRGVPVGKHLKYTDNWN